MQFTVFWSHPYHGSGSLQVDATTAKQAGDDTSDSLAEDFAEDEDDMLEVASIRDDLEIDVFEGAHKERPTATPEFTVA